MASVRVIGSGGWTRTSDLRVMRQSRGSGTLQRTGSQNNPTVVFEFGLARWIAWTDLEESVRERLSLVKSN